MIRSLQRGLAILEIIAKREQSAGLADLSRELGLHPSTVFHLLKTLASLGYVAQTPGTKTYRLGPKVFSLASAATHEQALVDLAMPHLVDLVRATGETSHLAIYDRGEVVVIAKLDGSGPMRLTERIGTPRPAHCTAIGKVLLAALSPTELKTHLARGRLERFTRRTITAPARLRDELATVRANGYAVDNEEYSLGLRCAAAPVRDFAGRVVAAMGLSAPAWRLDAARMAEMTETLRAEAAQLSAALGNSQAPGPTLTTTLPLRKGKGRNNLRTRGNGGQTMGRRR